MIEAGAKMTQMENRIVLARFKDGYGPVGAYFLHLKTYTQNGLGEEYESKWFPELQKMVGKEYLDPEASHLTHRPIPTCLRNHALISEVNAGRGPIHMVTMHAFQDPHLEEVGWENFLGMTVGQAVLWAATDVDPKNENPELTTSEPYVMGSHATGSGAWCSGPEDVSPPEYFWGYNRMTTVEASSAPVTQSAARRTPFRRAPLPRAASLPRPRASTSTTARRKASASRTPRSRAASRRSSSRWSTIASTATPSSRGT